MIEMVEESPVKKLFIIIIVGLSVIEIIIITLTWMKYERKVLEFTQSRYVHQYMMSMLSINQVFLCLAEGGLLR